MIVEITEKKKKERHITKVRVKPKMYSGRKSILRN